jgi:hypothetical protein
MLLIPSLVRSRLSTSPIEGVRSFEQTMGILGNTRKGGKAAAPGRWIMVPRSDVTAPVRRRSRVIKRRRQNFERILALAGVTLLLGFVPKLRWMWFVHLAVDAALGFYVTRLLRWKHDEAERARVVAPLPAEPSPAESPAVAEQRQSG